MGLSKSQRFKVYYLTWARAKLGWRLKFNLSPENVIEVVLVVNADRLFEFIRVFICKKILWKGSKGSLCLFSLIIRLLLHII